VIDIIRELQDFGVNVEVHDPLANPAEVQEEYGIELIPELKKEYHGIVMAVGHKAFLQMDLREIKQQNGIIYDVKSILDKSLVDGKL
jgi:UDP-N-acetyl-D-galactosamine dehydrogenase